jgi:hypothetical protein
MGQWQVEGVSSSMASMATNVGRAVAIW